jgi:hypothetical protein
MANTLYWNTVLPLLAKSLRQLMQAKPFAPFRLVGGTDLSLQLGHRHSDDIDLFTDADYGSIDFDVLHAWLLEHFPYVDTHAKGPAGMGKAYFIGESSNNSVKLDLYYHDPFIRPALVIDNIRMAHLEDIIAMKVDVIRRGGRMKDFWDLHEMMDTYSIDQMIAFHAERYPYQHDEDQLRTNFTRFEQADEDFTPVCLRGKYWELIKADFIEALTNKS